MTSVELAQAALSSEPLARALLLAQWIGDGRELTGTGVLRPAVAVEACHVLGLEVPYGKLRSARDVEELQQAWEIAVAGEFVLAGGSRVRAARDAGTLLRAAEGAESLPEELAERTLLAWVRGAGVAMGIPDEPCPLCLTVLHELTLATGSTETGDLVGAVREAAGGDPTGGVNVLEDMLRGGLDSSSDSADGYVCPDCGGVHDVPPELFGAGGLLDRADEFEDGLAEDAVEHARTAIGLLVYFDAAFTGPGRTPGGTVTLTPLGKMFAASVFGSLAAPADASAAEVVAEIAEMSPKVAAALTARWTIARSPVAATRELLDYARQAEPGLRFAALLLAREQGAGGLPAWRELAAQPGFGAYARQWLTSLGEQVTEDERDEAWLLADAMTQVSAEAPPGVMPLVLAAAMQQIAGDDAAVVLDGLRQSGHPAGTEIADAVGRFLRMDDGVPAAPPFAFDLAGLTGLGGPGGPGGPGDLGDFADDEDTFGDLGYDVPEGSLLQLKITLRGVSKPPVWRRVLVPASMTLAGLHEVIVRAMGWNGSHMHSFSDGMTDYGVPDEELDFEDESRVETAFLLSVPGERVGYTYDFGDGWEHDIRLEKVLDSDPARTVPVCLAGRGACPPDDCGGSYGYTDLKAVIADPRHEDHESLLEWLGLTDPAQFDPAEFSLDEVNGRLRRTGIAAV